jgi:hypothetical protein
MRNSFRTYKSIITKNLLDLEWSGYCGPPLPGQLCEIECDALGYKQYLPEICLEVRNNRRKGCDDGACDKMSKTHCTVSEAAHHAPREVLHHTSKHPCHGRASQIWEVVS